MVDCLLLPSTTTTYIPIFLCSKAIFLNCHAFKSLQTSAHTMLEGNLFCTLSVVLFVIILVLVQPFVKKPLSRFRLLDNFFLQIFTLYTSFSYIFYYCMLVMLSIYIVFFDHTKTKKLSTCIYLMTINIINKYLLVRYY